MSARRFDGSSGRWPAEDVVIKRDRARPVDGAEPCAANGAPRVRIGRRTPTSTELHVECGCGRSTVVVLEHEAGEEAA